MADFHTGPRGERIHDEQPIDPGEHGIKTKTKGKLQEESPEDRKKRLQREWYKKNKEQVLKDQRERYAEGKKKTRRKKHERKDLEYADKIPTCTEVADNVLKARITMDSMVIELYVLDAEFINKLRRLPLLQKEE